MDPSRISALLEPFFGPPADWTTARPTTSMYRPTSIYYPLERPHQPESPSATRNKSSPATSANHYSWPVIYSPMPARGPSPFARARGAQGRSWKARSSEAAPRPDLGSGAGFPALPIKIWEPQIHLTMIESNHKKAAFLREAARELKLMAVNVIAERADSVAVSLSTASDENAPNNLQPAEIATSPSSRKIQPGPPPATKFLNNQRHAWQS